MTDKTKTIKYLLELLNYKDQDIEALKAIWDNLNNAGARITRMQAEEAFRIAKSGVGNDNDDYYAFMTELGFDPEQK